MATIQIGAWRIDSAHIHKFPGITSSKIALCIQITKHRASYHLHWLILFLNTAQHVDFFIYLPPVQNKTQAKQQAKSVISTWCFGALVRSKRGQQDSPDRAGIPNVKVHGSFSVRPFSNTELPTLSINRGYPQF